MHYLQKLAVAFAGCCLLQAGGTRLAAQTGKPEQTRDSLARHFRTRTLTMMEQDIAIKPVALPRTAIENYKLAKAKIFDIDDPAHNLTRISIKGRDTARNSYTSGMRLVDIDEILHAAKKYTYVTYINEEAVPHIVSVRDLQNIFDYYRTAQKSFGHTEAKLYLGFNEADNAFNFYDALKKLTGVRPDIPSAMITTGLLQSHNIETVQDVSIHEAGHSVNKEIMYRIMNTYASTRRLPAVYAERNQIFLANQYREYQADSIALAYRFHGSKPYKNPLGNAAALYYLVSHQNTKIDYYMAMNSYVHRLDSTLTPQEDARLSILNRQLKSDTSFAAPADEDHPTMASRIFNSLVLQAYLEEVRRHGAETEYAQNLHSLLPVMPEIKDYKFNPPLPDYKFRSWEWRIEMPGDKSNGPGLRLR